MIKRINVITLNNNPMTLIGKEVIVGDIAPDFTVLNSSLAPVSLSDFHGKTVLISVVPSIDTSVCATQTRKFNEEAAKLDSLEILTISVDLPFALGRYCAAEGIDKIQVLSDHKELSFGLNYGFVIEELRILARGIIVVDPTGNVTYVETVSEVSNHPDYEKALEAAKLAI